MRFNDYHEIWNFVDRFNMLTSGKQKLKYTEVQSESDCGYVALFYFNKQDSAYKSALKKYEKERVESK